ncbi:hypothetical protein [Oleiharenicola sp. Vm1]|uniref:hypothetical protein n=1 Tax=Oleiharenicola sp. Vm1 TaxID=3398393 RepID=UPI0039F4F075
MDRAQRGVLPGDEIAHTCRLRGVVEAERGDDLVRALHELGGWWRRRIAGAEERKQRKAEQEGETAAGHEEGET